MLASELFFIPGAPLWESIPQQLVPFLPKHPSSSAEPRLLWPASLKRTESRFERRSGRDRQSGGQLLSGRGQWIDSISGRKSSVEYERCFGESERSNPVSCSEHASAHTPCTPATTSAPQPTSTGPELPAVQEYEPVRTQSLFFTT